MPALKELEPATHDVCGIAMTDAEKSIYDFGYSQGYDKGYRDANQKLIDLGNDLLENGIPAGSAT